MRKTDLIFALGLLAASSCGKDTTDPYRWTDYDYGETLQHGEIVLGERLDNPYTTENQRAAFTKVYPSRDREEVETTNLYVRFHPHNDDEYKAIEDLGLILTDYPLDYEIVRDGDWYHDPSLPDDGYTWLYAVVDKDFDFKGVDYELIDECFLSENKPVTRADDDIDWTAVEEEAYRMTGNSSRLAPQTKASKTVPKGRITMVDEDYAGGKPVGVAGVLVVCNSFVKFCRAYTDVDGYYEMDKDYSSDIRYRLVFHNSKGFSLGLNLIVLQASVSTLGKSSPDGINVTVSGGVENTLFRRCAVNNAAWEYYERCSTDDLDLPLPPSGLRIWLFNSLASGSAIMMHHGAILGENYIAALLGDYSSIVSLLLPDITLGMKDCEGYADIFSLTVHELAHASHYSQVGNDYWNKYIYYIMESFITTGQTYGNKRTEDSGRCEVGEMWAYFMQAKLWQDRYGGAWTNVGTMYWFYPQIFRYLNERGVSASQILKAMDGSATGRDALKENLLTLYPSKKSIINQVFNRYE